MGNTVKYILLCLLVGSNCIATELRSLYVTDPTTGDRTSVSATGKLSVDASGSTVDVVNDVDVNIHDSVGVTLSATTNGELRVFSKEFLTQVKMGLVPGYSLVHKFGRNSVVGTSFEPIAVNGVYRTPAIAPGDLEIVSTDADDTSAGLGAQTVTIQGLVLVAGKFVEAEEIVSMNGLTPVPLTVDFVRIYRAWVSRSGTYASMTSVSAQGTITISENVSGNEWLVISLSAAGNSSGQSQTAMFTTPSDTTSVLLSIDWSIESSKIVTLAFMHRPNADDVTAPFTGARRLVYQVDDAINASLFAAGHPVAFFSGCTDMGFMAKTSVGSSTISCDFWLLVIDD